ncbi:MAG TPA: pantoate--beta-alanine ligase, partial [Acidobacteriaceae bacterium]|nr:pantoate--beta-alanine ligase [Acidobacteriaceae bacterium]
MRILTSIAETRHACNLFRTAGKSLGLVPTMGALHAGHLSLIHSARESCDAVGASIFVNPTQFGPSEDFERYPRSFEQDCRLLEAAGVDFVFAPSVAEMYPAGASTFVEVAGLSDRLDGASRPGHFRGVATVVAKLFHIVTPDRAFFGQKDAAQVAILKKMVRDLAFPVEIRVCPIVREPDGLALSSRNQYLSREERQRALVLSRTLNTVAERVHAGEYESAALREEALRVLRQEPSVRLDYFAIVDPDTLEAVADLRQGALIAVAASVGTTRLIDNFLFGG